MFQNISSNYIKKIFPKRNPSSHKGQNGRVLIIGGSLEYFGAPILSAFASLKSGADLVYLLVPSCNFDVTRSYLPDFIVSSYKGDFLNKKAIPIIKNLLEKVDSVVIGPGVSENKKSLETIIKLLKIIDKPLVLDSFAIQALKNFKLQNKNICITPHRLEFEKFIGKKLPNDFEKIIKITSQTATKNNITILLKGTKDIICSLNGEFKINKTGNCGMTVGGTGDVLAGAVGTFLSQKAPIFESCIMAAYSTGKAGDYLYKTKNVFYLASEVANALSEVISLEL